MRLLLCGAGIFLLLLAPGLALAQSTKAYEKSIQPPGTPGYGAVFMDGYGTSAAYMDRSLLNDPLGVVLTDQFAKHWQAMCGHAASEFPTYPPAFNCTLYNYYSAINNGAQNFGNQAANQAVYPNPVAGMGAGYNTVNGQDVGDVSPAYGFTAGSGVVTQLTVGSTNDPPQIIAGDLVRNYNPGFYGGTGVSIDQLDPTRQFVVIAPIDNTARTFHIRCETIDHTNFPTQCPTAGAAFTSFTRSGTPVTDNNFGLVIHRQFDDGFTYNQTYIPDVMMSIEGMSILGYNMSAALAQGTTRFGVINNPQFPGMQWDATISLAAPAPGALTLTVTPTTANLLCAAPANASVATSMTSGGNGQPITYSMTGNLTDFAISPSTGAVSVVPAGIIPTDCGTTFTNTVTATQGTGGGGGPVPSVPALLTDTAGNLLTNPAGALLTSNVTEPCPHGEACQSWDTFSTVQVLTPSGDATGVTDRANIMAAQANCAIKTIELATGTYFVGSPGIPAVSGCIVEGHYSHPVNGTLVGGSIIEAGGSWGVGTLWGVASHNTFRNVGFIGTGSTGPNCLAGAGVIGVELDMVNVNGCNRGVSISGTGNKALRWHGGSAIGNYSYGGFFQNLDDMPVMGVTFRGNAADGTCNLDFDTGTSNIRVLGGYNETVSGAGCGVEYAGNVANVPGAMIQAVQFHNLGTNGAIWDNGGGMLTITAVQAGNDSTTGPMVNLTGAGALSFGGNVWWSGCAYKANAAPSGQFAIYEGTTTSLYCDGTTTTALQKRVVTPNAVFPSTP